MKIFIGRFKSIRVAVGKLTIKKGINMPKIIDEVKNDPKHMRENYRICKINRNGEIAAIDEFYSTSSWPLVDLPDVIDEVSQEFRIPKKNIVILKTQYVVIDNIELEEKKVKPKNKKPQVERLNKDQCFEMFDYATSIAEDVSCFIDREISGKQLLKQTYGKETKAWLKRNFNRCGVEATRKYLSRRLKTANVYRD